MRFVVGRAKFSGRSITVSVVCTDNKICCFLGFQQFLNKSIRIGQMLDYIRTNNQLCTENCFHALSEKANQVSFGYYFLNQSVVSSTPALGTFSKFTSSLKAEP